MRASAQALTGNPIVAALLQAADTFLLVLNPRREILAANLKFLGDRPVEQVLGLRPGEAVDCLHARECAGGCGTAPACKECGAFQTVLRSQSQGLSAEGECLLTVEGPQGSSALEFNVRATPVRFDGGEVTVVSMRDISAEKRRQALEQIFFHDHLNTLTGLLGWSRTLERGAGPRTAEVAARIGLLARQLEREVKDQRVLMQAERGTLQLQKERLPLEELLASLQVFFSQHQAVEGRTLEVRAPECLSLQLQTDRSILLRILANMVTNALEATGASGRVCLEVEALEGQGRVAFRVHNEGVMPARVQHHIFQRSFSTKAASGRGLGTYSMKLLGERYLGGSVSFTSCEERGTTFSLELPVG